MSYISKRGSEVEESINKSEKDYSKVLRSFKSGSTYKVRLLGAEDYVEYFAHSAFKIFYTTVHQEGDLYCKARKLIFAEADKEQDAKKKEDLMEMAKLLKPAPRYLFGFVLLEGDGAGEQIILDLTKKQAKTLIASIKKNAAKIGKKAFEIEKIGTGTDTSVTITSLDLEDLNEAEAKRFHEWEGKPFDFENFENVFSVNSEEQQLDDLRKLGFDITKLTGGATPEEKETLDEAAGYDF